MKPVRCTTCQLQWSIREDAPRVLTCPRCLSSLNNPYPPSLPSGPMRVLPLEREVRRDVKAGHIGIVVILGIVGFGVLGLFAAGVSGAEASTVLLMALAVIVAAVIAAIIVAARSKLPAPAQGAMGVIPSSAPAIPMAPLAPGSVLNYQPPTRDPRRLSGAAFLGQTIGGIVAGIVISIVLTAMFAQIGNGQPAILGILIPPALGIALLLQPRVRGLGLGLLIALPAGFLILLGFCAILIGSGGLNFH